jgi:hypothetical protein
VLTFPGKVRCSPSPALRAAAPAAPGRDGKARLPDRTGTRVLRYHRVDKQVPLRAEGDRDVQAPSMDDRRMPLGGGTCWAARSPGEAVDKMTRRREHSGEAMLGPLGSIPG